MNGELPAGVLSGRHRCHWQQTALAARAEAARLRRTLQALGVDPTTPDGARPAPSRWRDQAADLAQALRNLLDDPSPSRANARAALARYDNLLAADGHDQATQRQR
ncbi:MAG: hypothetical protein AB1679_12440 [Actinomycetota bacterium]